MYVVIAVENRAMFELDEEHWYRGFHEASRHGSAVFGLAGALENWNWLKEHEGTLEDWFGDAVEWWVDENEEDEEGKRVHLQAALAQMKDELFELFGEVEKQHLGIPRAFRVVSRHQT
ncbi:uncharacterized protein JCM6883_003095 [Sporobolomyces salmoneus]|uniref:uncharacterized protein n=1 Tax=Sporobolomyces salmoneus TaxID=183962 RepID=UPI0031798471